VKTLVLIFFALFGLILLIGPTSVRIGEAQVTITPGTDDQAQEEPEPEAEPEPAQMQPQQSSPGTKRISQELEYAHFIPLTNSPGNQVKLLLNYTVDDSSLIDKPVNAVMEVDSANQSLIRVSSFSEPIVANQSGTVQLATTFTNEKINNIIATTTFTGPGKLVSISNPVTVDLTLGQVIEK